MFCRKWIASLGLLAVLATVAAAAEPPYTALIVDEFNGLADAMQSGDAAAARLAEQPRRDQNHR